ncbi:MAG: TetR/AcrR family transcriptional regulator [Pseudomonadota bacterium]
MVGVKQFDEDIVIEAVLRTFWDKGYCETTMADLAAASGVQRGSLYNAYGGKDRLLLMSLERYGERYGAAAERALEKSSPREAMKAFLESHLDRMLNPKNPAGCLMCQTVMECSGRDDALTDFISRHFQRVEMAIRETLCRGRDGGLLRGDVDVRSLARFFLGVSRGMAVLHRAYGDIEPARDMAKAALKLIDMES